MTTLVLSYPMGFAPRTPLHAPSRAAAPARSGRVARSHGSLAPWNERQVYEMASSLIRGASPLGLPYTRPRAPLRRRAPVAWLARTARSLLGTSVRFMRWLLVLSEGLRPSDSPYTRPRAPLRRRAPVAWLARTARLLLGTSVGFMRWLLAYPRGFAPRTPLHAPSRAAAPARSGRVARSHGSLAPWNERQVYADRATELRTDSARAVGAQPWPVLHKDHAW